MRERRRRTEVVPYRRTEEGAFVNKRQEETHIFSTKHVESVGCSVTGLFKSPSHDVPRAFRHGEDALPVPLLQVKSVNFAVWIEQLLYQLGCDIGHSGGETNLDDVIRVARPVYSYLVRFTM